jgi:hypothetical protein
LELDDAVATASQAPKQNAFEVIMSKAYEGNDVTSCLIKQAFDIRPELSDNPKKKKMRKIASSSTGNRLATLRIPAQHSPQSSKPNSVPLSLKELPLKAISLLASFLLSLEIHTVYK